MNTDKTTIYLVGDSTLASFCDGYYYPRYGYGTQLAEFINGEAQVCNLALSGRSSKSFVREENYSMLEGQIRRGDILIIGFGHNDEKSDDPARFTDASLPYTDERSFGYHLNKYYVRLALSVGAYPVLCTPIARANEKNDYSGVSGHITEHGDYRLAVQRLGEALGVPVVDICAATSERYVRLGYEGALKHHAVITGKYAEDGETVVPDMTTVDTTHLNLYGASTVAYMLAKGLENIEYVKNYVREKICEPSENILLPNPDYKIPRYSTPCLENYVPPKHFFTEPESGWYGTAFGSVGDDPENEKTGYVARQDGKNEFSVGQRAGTSKGKISRDGDGFAFAFRRVGADENFTLSAECVVECHAKCPQSAFGIMLRDNCIVGQREDGAENANYVTAGLLLQNDKTAINFWREGGRLGTDDICDVSAFDVGEVYHLSIERVGQSVNVKLVRDGEAFLKTHIDFDFLAVDTEYMFVGMFACRGTVVKFYNVEFKLTGKSQGA